MPSVPPLLCHARIRNSTDLCQSLAVTGKSRCHHHGGDSIGPRTLEGKAKVSLNAWKHGRRSREAVRLRKQVNDYLRGASSYFSHLMELAKLMGRIISLVKSSVNQGSEYLDGGSEGIAFKEPPSLGPTLTPENTSELLHTLNQLSGLIENIMGTSSLLSGMERGLFHGSEGSSQNPFFTPTYQIKIYSTLSKLMGKLRRCSGRFVK